jgi:hypothetical protein
MKKRNSRWDDEPRLDAKGQPIVVYPCASDIVIFRLLHRYRYLPIDFIQAHTGLSYSYLKTRLDLLARKPNKFLNRPEKQRAQPNANYRFLIYELAFRGETVLKDHLLYSKEPRLGDEHMFAHSLMASETIVSLEIAHTGKMIWWPEIAGRLKDAHRSIPVHIEHQFDNGRKVADFEYFNDSNGPFGILYPDGTARFLSLEAEHTNQVDCSNLTKTSFLKKYLAIRYIMEHKLHTKHWGIPNLITLVVTSSQARIDTMKDLIMRETKGKGCAYIAFALIPVLEDPFKAAKPMPELFTAGWQRAGHPDLFLNSPTAKAAA